MLGPLAVALSMTLSKVPFLPGLKGLFIKKRVVGSCQKLEVSPSLNHADGDWRRDRVSPMSVEKSLSPLSAMSMSVEWLLPF